MTRTVDGLVDTVALALAIRNTAQAGTGQKTNAIGNDAGLVSDNVTKQVARHNNTVETGRVLDHDHGRAVNELVLDLEVGELLLKRLGHDLAPESARGQHVSLVQRPHLLVATAAGQETSQAGNALHLGAGVRLSVPGRARAIVLRSPK